MMTNQNRESFNTQANKYSKWSVTKNVEYLQKYYDFCRIKEQDEVLDVACGSGDFLICISDKIKSGYGIDISDKLIELGTEKTNELNIKNISFLCKEFNSVDIKKEFSCVVCRMAFHHFTNINDTFSNMMKHCKSGGYIGIQDIIAHEDYKVHNYFDTLEKYIDKSHNKSLSIDEITKMYSDHDIKIITRMELDRDICLDHYIQHAVQSKETKQKIYEMIEEGLEDSVINKYLFEKDGKIYFKRKIFLILGEKK